MTIKHLRIFITVYQKESITKAAAILHLAQPSVSLAIKELEKYYNIHLFDRIGKRLYITEQGEKFYSYALHIISMFDEMEKDITTWNNKGVLKIGSSVTVGNFILPHIVSLFKKQHPNIEVQMYINNTKTIEQELINNKLDFAIVEGKSQFSQLHLEKLMEDPLCIICAKQHPLAKKNVITLKELESCSMILRERGSAVRETIEECMGYYQINHKVICESISTQAIIRSVSQNLGISILPYLLVQEALEQNKIVQLNVSDFHLTRDFSIIYHTKKYLSPILTSFIEICREQIPSIIKK